MPGTSGHKATPSGNLFATRLTQAIDNSGLTLARIRSAIAERGLSVSGATLSYWTSGRSMPTRARSRLLLEELEQVLGVEAGWLTDAIAGPTAPDGLHLSGNGEKLARAIEELGVRRDRGWQQIVVHQITTIGVDRAEKSAETRELVRAPRDGMQYWALAMTGHAGNAVCEETAFCDVVVSHEVEPGTTLFGFATSRPLSAGEAIGTRYRIAYPLNGDECCEVGYGLTDGSSQLLIEVRFDGEMPRHFQRRFTPGDQSEPLDVEGPLVMCGSRVQCVVEKAQPGIHWLSWEW